MVSGCDGGGSASGGFCATVGELVGHLQRERFVQPAQRDGKRAAEEETGAKGFRQSAQWKWGGPGDGSRSRDEMRALAALELDSDADFKAIKAAYRKLAKENHPDLKQGDEEAAKRFQQIQAAYDVLRAAEERREGKAA